MPIYTTKCTKCANIDRDMRKFEEPDPPCTKCGSESVKCHVLPENDSPKSHFSFVTPSHGCGKDNR